MIGIRVTFLASIITLIIDALELALVSGKP